MEIIAAAPQTGSVPSCRPDAESVVIEMIARRPCTLDDLVTTLGMSAAAVKKIIDGLETADRIESVQQERGLFYQLKDK